MSGRLRFLALRLRPLLGLLAGLGLAALVMQVSGYSVSRAYGSLATGATGLQPGPARSAIDLALGGWHLNKWLLAQSLARVTPLLLAGLSVALGLRAGLFNIGAQGQMTFGALLAAAFGASATGKSLAGHAPLAITLALTIGILGGAAWGALPGLLKAGRGVHEVLSTIMLNYVALNVSKYLITHSLRDTVNQAAQSPLIPRGFWLAPLVPGSDLTVGLGLALLAAFGTAFLIRRTALGFQIRAVGQGVDAARAAGLPVGRTLVVTMALSGGLAGLAGAIQVIGVHHRFVEGLAGSYGYDGIAVALLGGLGAVGVLGSALFFGALARGAGYMEALTQIPASIATLVQAIVILFVGAKWLRDAHPTDTPTEPISEADHANV